MFACVLNKASLLQDESGQTLVLGALGIFVLVSIVGMAVDVGSLRATQRRLQAAAEAAALSAALEIPYCAGSSACGIMQTAAQTAITENGLTLSRTVLNCATASGAGISLTINNGPCALGTADPNTGSLQFVEVILNDPQPTIFARFAGTSLFPITARAEAARTSNPNCIYALDPTGANAINVTALATLNSACGIVDESNSASAFSCSLLATVTAPQIKVVGGVASLLCTVQPAARTNSPLPSPTDPLAYLPKPAVGSCGTSLVSPYTGSPLILLLAGTVTLYPGTYCGGINVLPTARVTFMPGTYVIKGGGMSFDLGSTVTGNGVTFYNYGPSGGVTFLLVGLLPGSFTLTAPVTGTYAGVLFFQDAQDTAAATIVGSSSVNSVVQGALYFPSATLTTALSGSASYNVIVAKDIVFAALTFGSTSASASVISNNYSSLAGGSPLAGSGSVLVQ